MKGVLHPCDRNRQRFSGKGLYVKYISALLLFGSNGVAASHIGLNSHEIVLLRSALGSVILIAVFFLTGHKLTILRHRRDAFLIALSGMAMALDWLLLFEAYQRTGVSLAMLINYCSPVIVVIISAALFKERLTRIKAAALIMAMTGAFLISGQAVTGGADVRGLLFAGLSALACAAMVIFNRQSREITGMENAALQLFFAAVTAALFVWRKQGLYMEIKSEDWFPILWIGLLNTGGGCYLYFSSIGRLPVQTVAICGYLEPLSAVLFSAVFLHERLLPLQVAGALLITGGALTGEGIFAKSRRQWSRHPL